MKCEDLSDLVFVDFDAFGSPAPAMKAFFANYPIKKPLYIGVTDGAGHYISMNNKRSKWIPAHYGVDAPKHWNRKQQAIILGKFVRRMGKKYGFTVEQVNVDHGDQWAIYLGYKLTPAR